MRQVLAARERKRMRRELINRMFGRADDHRLGDRTVTAEPAAVQARRVMAVDVAECSEFTVLDAARIEDVGWPLIDELAGDALAFDHAQAAFEQVGGRDRKSTRLNSSH